MNLDQFQIPSPRHKPGRSGKKSQGRREGEHLTVPWCLGDVGGTVSLEGMRKNPKKWREGRSQKVPFPSNLGSLKSKESQERKRDGRSVLWDVGKDKLWKPWENNLFSFYNFLHILPLLFLDAKVRGAPGIPSCDEGSTRICFINARLEEVWK